MREGSEFSHNSENGMKNEKLLDNNIKMLFSWGKPNVKQKIKRCIRKYLLRQALPPVDQWFWPQAMLAEGIMAAMKSATSTVEEKKRGLEALEQYYKLWITSKQNLYYVDNAMHGNTLLDLYELTGKEAYLTAAEKLADYLKDCPKDAEGSVSYRVKNPDWIFADALGMVCPFLCRYGEMTGRKELTELAVKQLDNFLNHGMDQNSGLPYHGYDSKTGIKQGCIGWGRAVGWLMMGLNGCLKYLPETHPQYQILSESAVKLEQTVWEYQRTDGGFSWLLAALEGPEDTSATGMILDGIYNGRILQDGTKEKDFENAMKFLFHHISGGNVTGASGECEGYAQYPQKYGVYPWGNGIVLKLIKKTEYSK